MDVDLLRAFRHLRQTGDAVGQDLGEPERDQEVVLLGALPVPELAGAEQREKRRMSGQDAEVALRPGDLDLVDLLVDERSIRRHDLQLQMWGERHGALLRQAGAIPTRRPSASRTARARPRWGRP